MMSRLAAASFETTAVDDLSTIAERLRLIRTISQQRRYSGGRLPRLPSKDRIAAIVRDLVAILYPRHFGPEGLTADETDHYIRGSLGSLLERIADQVQLELLLPGRVSEAEARARSEDVARSVLDSLPRIRDLHDTDVAAAFAGDPSTQSIDEIVFCFPGIAAILRHCIAHEFYCLGAPMTGRIMAELSHALTAIDIHPGARVGPAFFIDHGTGVVIGETAVIGRNVRLYQQVTLGAKRFEADETGALVKGLPRHPLIEDDVVIYAGATVLGRISVGKGSVIGGGVWITSDVPPGSTVTQARPTLQVTNGG
jgi:serine O-acetyltransferase